MLRPRSAPSLSFLFPCPVLTTRLDLPTAALTAAAVAGFREAKEGLLASPALRQKYRETSVDAAANNEYFRAQGESVRRGSHDPRLLAVPEFEQLLRSACLPPTQPTHPSV